MIPKRKHVDPRANENRFPSSPCLLALPQARFPSADDRLRLVSNLQFSEDVRDIVANGLRTEGELPGDRRVGM